MDDQMIDLFGGKVDIDRLVLLQDGIDPRAPLDQPGGLFPDQVGQRFAALISGEGHLPDKILYPALEDRALDIMIGKGPSARSIRVDLQPFTLVGATTRAGQLSAPLRDRFGIVQRLELYTPEQLCDIIRRSAMLLDIPCETDGAMELAKRSRGTPRIANRLLRRVRDFADVLGTGVIDAKTTREALERLEIDELGLDKLDHRMLDMMIRGYHGGPVGLETLASAIGEEAVTLEDVCEPYLMQLGMLARTPRGRCATQLAYQHLGYPVDDNAMGQQYSLSDMM